MIKQNIAKLLDAEMDRKDFLKLLSLGAVAAVGVTSIIKAITPTAQSNTPAQPSARSLGYGAIPYGGNAKDVR